MNSCEISILYGHHLQKEFKCNLLCGHSKWDFTFEELITFYSKFLQYARAVYSVRIL